MKLIKVEGNRAPKNAFETLTFKGLALKIIQSHILFQVRLNSEVSLVFPLKTPFSSLHIQLSCCCFLNLSRSFSFSEAKQKFIPAALVVQRWESGKKEKTKASTTPVQEQDEHLQLQLQSTACSDSHFQLPPPSPAPTCRSNGK